MNIIVENVSKKYGGQQILQDVNLSISVGECVAITGRNGCGKTTLLSILMGIEQADSGKVILPTKDFKIGYLPQVNPLLTNLSVENNLKLWAKDKAHMVEALSKFELKDIRRKSVGKLSGGMQRRVAIACALVNEPDLLVMDEPIASLDIIYKQVLHEEIKKFREKGGTVIMVTHEKEEIEMCDRVLHIEAGMVS